MPRHMSPDFGEIGFAGAGFVDELTVKHSNQAVGQEKNGANYLANRPSSGSPVIAWVRNAGL